MKFQFKKETIDCKGLASLAINITFTISRPEKKKKPKLQLIERTII
jgi:hypothetical protein